MPAVPPEPSGPQRQPPRQVAWLWPLMLALGSLTVVVAWTSLALASGRQHGWVALLAALEVAWMLRLGGMAPGWPRRLLALAATVAMILAVQWLVAAGHIGAQLGLAPWQAAPKMGAAYVWTLSQLANTAFDLACLALAPPLALWAAR